LHLAAEKFVPDTARETVELYHEYWRTEMANLPLSADIIRSIENHIATVPLA